MRLLRFDNDGRPRIGALKGDGIVDLVAAGGPREGRSDPNEPSTQGCNIDREIGGRGSCRLDQIVSREQRSGNEQR